MTEIIQARPDDVPRLAAMLTRAYREDPIFRYFVPGPDRERWIEREFLVYDAIGAREGWLWTTPERDGVAWWQPPGHRSAADEAEALVRREVWPDSPDGGAHYVAFWDRAFALAPREPHWYLDHVGVDPDRQGRWIGSALIRHGLGLAAADGLPVWLETCQRANLPLYEHLGFRVMHEEDAPMAGPHVWFMQAEP